MPPVNAKNTIHDFYTYGLDFASLLQGTSATGQISIQADSDFVVQKLTYQADIAAATQTDSSRVVPNVTVQIKDTGSGRELFSTAVPLSSVFGSGQLPFILPQPKIFLARSTISITVANFDAAADYNIRLAFIGYKIFNLNGA